MNLGNAYGKIILDVSSVEAGARTARSAVQSLESGLGNISSKFSNLSASLAGPGRTISAAITAPVAALASLGVKAFADYETSLNLVGTISQATAGQLGQLGAKAKQLGIDTQFGAGEAASAMLELAKAGLAPTTILEAIGETLNLAAAGGLGLADASAIAANAMQTFKFQAADLARVSDTLAGTANASTQGVTDIAEALKSAGPVFSSSDPKLAANNFDDLNASLAILANNGLKGGLAGTGLRRVMLNLQSPTKKAAAALEQLGLRTDVAFDADTGKARRFGDVLADVTKATEGLTDAQAAPLLQDIFGAFGINAINILRRSGVPAFEAMRDKITESGSAAELAEARMKGLGGALLFFAGSAETALINLVEPFSQGLGDIIRSTANLITAFATSESPIKNFALAFTGILAASGPILLALSGLASAAALVTGAVGGPVVAIAALGAALATNTFGIRDFTKGLLESAKTLPIVSDLTADFKEGLAAISAVSNSAALADVTANLRAAFAGIGEVAKSVFSGDAGIGAAAASVRESFSFLPNALEQLASSTEFQNLTDFVQVRLNALGFTLDLRAVAANISKGIAKSLEFGSDLKTAFSTFSQTLASSFKFSFVDGIQFEDFQNLGKRLQFALRTALFFGFNVTPDELGKSLNEKIVAEFTKLQTTDNPAFNLFAQSFLNRASLALTDGFQLADLSTIGTAFNTSLINALKLQFDSNSESLGGVINDGLIAGLSSALTSEDPQFNAVGEKVVAQVSAALSDGFQLADLSTLGSALNTTISAALESSFNIDVESFITPLKSGLQSLREFFVGGPAIIDEEAGIIQEGSQGIFAGLGTKLLAGAQTAFTALSTQFEEIDFTAAFSTIKTGIQNALGLLFTEGETDAFSLDGINEKLNGAAGSFAKFNESLTTFTSDEGPVGKLGTFLSDTLTQLTGLFENADADTAATSFSGVVDSVLSVFTTLKTIEGISLADIAGNVGGLLTSITEFSTKFSDALDGEILGGKIAESAVKIVDELTNALGAPDLPQIAVAASKLVGSLGTTLGQVLDGANLTAVGSSFGNLATTLVGQLTSTFSQPEIYKNIGTGLADLATGIVGGLADILVGIDFAVGFSALPAKFSEALANIFGDEGSLDLTTSLSNLGAKFSEALTNVFGDGGSLDVATPISNLGAKISESINNLFADADGEFDATAVFNKPVELFRNATSALVGGIASSLTQATQSLAQNGGAEKLGQVAGQTVAALTGVVIALLGALSGAIIGAVEGLKAGDDSAVASGIKDFLLQFLKGFTEGLSGIDLDTAFASFRTRIAEGITSALDGVLLKVAQLLEPVNLVPEDGVLQGSLNREAQRTSALRQEALDREGVAVPDGVEIPEALRNQSEAINAQIASLLSQFAEPSETLEEFASGFGGGFRGVAAELLAEKQAIEAEIAALSQPAATPEPSRTPRLDALRNAQPNRGRFPEEAPEVEDPTSIFDNIFSQFSEAFGSVTPDDGAAQLQAAGDELFAQFAGVLASASPTAGSGGGLFDPISGEIKKTAQAIEKSVGRVAPPRAQRPTRGKPEPRQETKLIEDAAEDVAQGQIPPFPGWETIFPPLEFVLPEFSWELFVLPFEWPVVAPPSWSDFIPELVWPRIAAPVWRNFIPRISWPSIPPPNWADYIPPINWPTIPAFPGWEAFVDRVTIEVPAGGGGGGGGGGGLPPPLPPVGGPAAALGGFAPGGRILVGEEGPEFVDLPANSFVTTADETFRQIAIANGQAAPTPSGQGPVMVQINAKLDNPISVEQVAISVTRELRRRRV